MKANNGSLDFKQFKTIRKVTQAMKIDIFVKAKNKCWYCGVELNFNNFPNHQYGVVDHILPVSLGGTDDMENLRSSCYLCNARKGNRHVENFRESIVSKLPGMVASDLIFEAMHLYEFSNKEELRKAMLEPLEKYEGYLFYGEREENK